MSSMILVILFLLEFVHHIHNILLFRVFRFVILILIFILGIRTTAKSTNDILLAIHEDVRHPMGEPCTNSQLMQTLSPSNSQTLATEGTSKNSYNGKATPEKLNKIDQEELKVSLVVVVDTINFAIKVYLNLVI